MSSEIEIFLRMDISPILASAAGKGYFGLSESFFTASKVAAEKGEEQEAQTLRLLCDALSMMLHSESLNEPFKPLSSLGGKRSTAPEDFKTAEVVFFAFVAENTDNPWLKARLADIVWLLGKPRTLRFALLAIDSYCAVPLTARTWLTDGKESWRRAIALAKLVGRGAGDRLDKIEALIGNALRHAGTEDVYFAIGLSKLLASQGLASQSRRDIAEQFESFGRFLNDSSRFDESHDCYAEAESWYRKAQLNTKQLEMIVNVAEAWASRASAMLNSDEPLYAVAAGFHENAMRILRKPISDFPLKAITDLR